MPLVRGVVLPALVVSASCSVHVPPTPLKVNEHEKDVPFVVTVLLVVALNVMVPVEVHVVLVFNDILPETASVGVVPVIKDQPVTLVVISRQANAPVMVTLPGVPLPLSKNTLSAAVGTDAPEPPPEAVDQLVVEVVFHVPAPPTQYLFAMFSPPYQEGAFLLREQQ